MKLRTYLLIAISNLLLVCVYAESNYNRTYGDAWYELEKKYPTPQRRYSRQQLNQARRRANNSLWMEQYGKSDPIYQSDQYQGRSSGYSSPYRSNKFGHHW